MNCLRCWKLLRIPFPIKSEKYCNCDVPLERRDLSKDSILKTTKARVDYQLQFALSGKLGRFCRLGCCDFNDKYARHSCLL